MPKSLKAKKAKRPKAVQVIQRDRSAVATIGTKRWHETVPKDLQDPLGRALHAMEDGRLGEALIAFGECWDIAPMSRPVVVFGGEAAARGYFQRKGEQPNDPALPQYYEMARTLLEAAYELDPGDAVACHNLGRFLQDCGEDHDAIKYYAHALMLNSSQVETWGNLGTALYQQGRVDEAWARWNRAVALPTDKASGRLAQSYIHLRKGEYVKGWAAYYDRWKDREFAQGYGRRDLGDHRRWDGKPLPKSHRLYVHGEQGLGDHVQFARYVALLLDRGSNIVGLETRAPLQRWMQASFPGVPVVVRDVDPPPDFTHHVSTLDLPHLLETTLETVPPPVEPGVGPCKALHDVRGTFSTGDIPDGRLAVGIAWHGAAGNPADAMRSIPAECLAELADIPNVQWVNLQFGEGDGMAARAWLNAIDGTEGCTDVLDTAAVIRGLDLVICVDTLTAHLAGTLGVPTWVLHRFCREWRWLDHGEVCPWYPSVRSLTVPAPGDWRGLLKTVRAGLEAMT